MVMEVPPGEKNSTPEPDLVAPPGTSPAAAPRSTAVAEVLAAEAAVVVERTAGDAAADHAVETAVAAGRSKVC